jgi:hypothetical protein
VGGSVAGPAQGDHVPRLVTAPARDREQVMDAQRPGSAAVRASMPVPVLDGSNEAERRAAA